MGTTYEHSVKITSVCDRCGVVVMVDNKANLKADEGWLHLQTDYVRPEERYDLCPGCAKDFREGFLKAQTIDRGKIDH